MVKEEVKYLRLGHTQILIGSMVGKGQIRLDNGGGAPVYMDTAKNSRDRELLKLKAERLKMLRPRLKNESLLTLRSELLRPLFEAFYGSPNKSIPREFLFRMDDLAVAIWYMENGGRNTRNGKPYLKPRVFSWKEELANILKLRLKFESAELTEYSKGADRSSYCITFDPTEFYDRINPYLTKERKVDLLKEAEYERVKKERLEALRRDLAWREFEMGLKENKEDDNGKVV
jgi:hypothetical protein